MTRTITRILPEALRAHWRSGVHWLAYNMLGMVGLWGVALLILAFFEDPIWGLLFDRGQLFLYSVGFLCPALYVLQKERKITTFPHRGTLAFLSFSAFTVAVLLFTGATIASISDAPDFVPNFDSLVRSHGRGDWKREIIGAGKVEERTLRSR